MRPDIESTIVLNPADAEPSKLLPDVETEIARQLPRWKKKLKKNGALRFYVPTTMWEGWRYVSITPGVRSIRIRSTFAWGGSRRSIESIHEIIQQVRVAQITHPFPINETSTR